MIYNPHHIMTDQYTYPNGFRIIYQKSTNTVPISYIYAFCDVGSVYEQADIRGVSHFIEHMCFKGTNKIPKMKDLLMYYDKIGAYFNAYTEKRYTTYTLRCDDEYIENSLQIMSDMILNSKFDKHEFRKEERVVIEESIKNSDDELDILFNEIYSKIYKGSSFENDIDELSYHDKKFDYDKVVDYYKRFYHPSRVVLSIVSNIPFSRFKRHLKHFLFVKFSESCSPSYAPISYQLEPQTDIQISLIPKKDTNTTHLCIGFRVLYEDKYPLNLLKNILSSSFTSRLFMLLREKEGLTYTSKIFTEYNEIFGGFIIYAEADKNLIIRNHTHPGVLPIIIRMINDLIHHGVTQKELELAKGYLHGTMNMNMSDGDNIVTYNGKHALMFPDETVIPYTDLYDKKYASITKSDILNVIRKYFIKDGMSVCMIGENLPKIDIVRKICDLKKIGR